MTEGQQVRSPLVQFVARLQQAEIDWDAENIADLLWLSRYVEGARGQEPQETNDTGDTKPIVRSEVIDSGQVPPPVPDLGLYVPRSQAQPASKPRSPASGIPVQVPTAPSLRKTLSIGRSLRPLMRKVDSYTRTVLDEEATAEQTAERRFCMTVVKPAQERWLEVALVIEETALTFVWQETIQEFKQLLEHQGAFRSVNCWYLRTERGQVKLFSQPSASQRSTSQRQASQRQTSRNLKELIDSSGRRLIILISDCVSDAWQQGSIQSQCLELWAKHSPIAIMQLLPEEWWLRTKLRSGVRVKLSGLTPGAPNQALGLYDVPLWSEGRSGLKLPVVTLEPESLERWARMVSGFGEYRAPGVWFDEGWQQWQQQDSEQYFERIDGLTPEQLVHQFSTTASLLARRLASLMALFPIELPIVYLIQATILPESTPLHVAEVFMSGLVQRVENSENPSRSRSNKTYEFVPGVSDRLIDLADRLESEQLLDRVSQYIGQKMGRSIYNFTALLQLEKELEGSTGTKDLQRFARVTRQTVQRLGGSYAAFVQDLDDVPPLKLIQFPPLESLEFMTVQLVEEAEVRSFALQTEQFTVATLTLEPELDALQPFEFTVATLQSRPEGSQPRRKGQKKGKKQITEWAIEQRQQQAWRWNEPLTEGLNLEMVGISSGTFLMGSPEDEPERVGNESPQHQVTVAEFLMGRYPVTQAQWRFVAGLERVDRSLEADPSNFKGDYRPVERISWLDATEFCARLSRHTGHDYRLPTEAEWEYACRAGTTTPFHFGEMIVPDLANYGWDQTYNQSNITKKKDFGGTTPVDHFEIANAFDLSDMHGNVWEWCQDQWHSNYQNALHEGGSAWIDASVNPQDENVRRVLRGGSWFNDPGLCRSATRSFDGAGVRNDNVGFRVVCVAPRT
jgi:formylglycine-generating enzyme required for sulfatase activity